MSNAKQEMDDFERGKAFLKIVGVVLLVIAMIGLCSMSNITFYREPLYLKLTLNLSAHTFIELFTGRESGTGLLYTRSSIIEDMMFATQWGFSFEHGKWLWLKNP